MGTNTTIALYYNRNTYKLTINVDGGILNGNTDTSVIIGKYEDVANKRLQYSQVK